MNVDEKVVRETVQFRKENFKIFVQDLEDEWYGKGVHITWFFNRNQQDGLFLTNEEADRLLKALIKRKKLTQYTTTDIVRDKPWGRAFLDYHELIGEKE